jgi:hypothetical protein
VPEHERRGAGRLEAEHHRPRRHQPRVVVRGEAAPVGADVARVADRDGEVVGRPTEVLADLEGGRLLALEAVRVDRVDEGHRPVRLATLGQPANDLQRGVERAVDSDDLGAGDLRGNELAQRETACLTGLSESKPKLKSKSNLSNIRQKSKQKKCKKQLLLPPGGYLELPSPLLRQQRSPVSSPPADFTGSIRHQ